MEHAIKTNLTDGAADQPEPHHHDPHLAHHFHSMEQQHESAKLGLWLFLLTEILLFGGMFCFYVIMHVMHPEMFVRMNKFLSWEMGGINTLVLITSSLTAALAIRSCQLNKPRQAGHLLLFTVLCGAVFMVVKSFEYKAKFDHGLLPGMYFHYVPHSLDGLKDGIISQANPHIFMSIYFCMTGVHGLHVLIGMGYLTYLMIRCYRGDFSSGYYTPVEMGGLYWHLVDLIWIYLFPLLYLIG